MSPARIASEAKRRDIQLAALTDHNTARNTPAFAECCRREGITGIYGMEVTTREEAHVLALFADVKTAERMGRQVEASLPELTRRPSPFGDQPYVDADEYVLGEVSRALFAATDFSTEELVELTHSLGGLVIPSHIDRPAFSIVIQLGFLPNLPFDAVECVSPPCGTDTYGIPVVTSSDAHYPEDIGSRPLELEMEEPSFAGLQDALAALARREK
jgi:hypothetical protein